jgi:hybrid cluster-associated redox disulfide protein
MAITKEQGIFEIVEEYPQTKVVFQRYGLGCLGCAAVRYESLEEGALAHGVDINALVDDLNKAI